MKITTQFGTYFVEESELVTLAITFTEQSRPLVNLMIDDAIKKNADTIRGLTPLGECEVTIPMQKPDRGFYKRLIYYAPPGRFHFVKGS